MCCGHRDPVPLPSRAPPPCVAPCVVAPCVAPCVPLCGQYELLFFSISCCTLIYLAVFYRIVPYLPSTPPSCNNNIMCGQCLHCAVVPGGSALHAGDTSSMHCRRLQVPVCTALCSRLQARCMLYLQYLQWALLSPTT